MVAGVHDAQHSQAVSPLRVMASSDRSSHSGTADAHSGHRRERRLTSWARSTRECDYHSDYSDGLLALFTKEPVIALSPL